MIKNLILYFIFICGLWFCWDNSGAPVYGFGENFLIKLDFFIVYFFLIMLKKQF